MKKYILLSILSSISFNFLFGQKIELKLLKNYECYIEKNVEMGKWSTKYFLKNGLITTQENYYRKELRSQKIFEYDTLQNITKETETYNINDGKVNIVLLIKLYYKNNLLIKREFDYGIIEKYKDFNEFNKPKSIERVEQSIFKIFPFKEQIEYDKKGNIIKSIEYSINEKNGKIVHEKTTTYFKYDRWNNIIEIHREYKPKQKFPIIMTGGPFKYESEYFRYKYKKNGLWSKKYKIINGKESLIMKRKYKKRCTTLCINNSG